MSSTHQKSLVRDLRALGFEGPIPLRHGRGTRIVDGHGREVYRHPRAGVVRVASTPEPRDYANTIAKAKRKVRFAESMGNVFADFVCTEFDIGQYEERDITVSMADYARRWLATLPRDERPVFQTVLTALTRSGRGYCVRASSPSVWHIRGRLVIEPEEGEEPQEAPETLPAPQAAEEVQPPAEPAPAPQEPIQELYRPPQLPAANGFATEALRKAFPELERILTAGVRAEEKNRQETMALAAAHLRDVEQEVHGIYRRMSELSGELSRKLKEMREVSDLLGEGR